MHSSPVQSLFSLSSTLVIWECINMSLRGSAHTQSYRIWERFPSPLLFEPALQTGKSGSFPKYGAMQGSALLCSAADSDVHIQARELPNSLIVHSTTTMKKGWGVQQQEKSNRTEVQLGPRGAEGALRGWRQWEQENVRGAKSVFTGKCQMVLLNAAPKM